MTSRISTVASMSRPLVGSSKIISSGSDSSARARPIRCFMPRENFPHRSLRYGVSPTISSTLSMRAWSTPG